MKNLRLVLCRRCDYRVAVKILGVLKKQNRYKAFISPSSDLNTVQNLETNLKNENISGQVECPSEDRSIMRVSYEAGSMAVDVTWKNFQWRQGSVNVAEECEEVVRNVYLWFWSLKIRKNEFRLGWVQKVSTRMMWETCGSSDETGRVCLV